VGFLLQGRLFGLLFKSVPPELSSTKSHPRSLCGSSDVAQMHINQMSMISSVLVASLARAELAGNAARLTVGSLRRTRA
jgi:hypothetical protein